MDAPAATSLEKHEKPFPSTSSESSKRALPLQPVMYRAEFSAPAIGVDRKNRVLRGYVVAQSGVTWHGDEFDSTTLTQIRDAINKKPNGLKARFTHPSMSDDGLGKFLGRSRNARIEELQVDRDGVPTSVMSVRADLHFDRTAFDTPPGGGRPLAEYVMDLAESDSDALSSSIVARKWEYETRLNADGTPQKDEQGKRLPDLMRVKLLHASDVVDTGAAVDGLFSAEMPERLVYWRAAEMLDRVFSGQDPEVIRGRCIGFLDRYLNLQAQPENQLDFSNNLNHGDDTMPETPKTPAQSAPVTTKSEPEQDSAAHEARLREEIRAEVRAEFSGQINELRGSLAKTQEELDRKALENRFSTGANIRKIRSAERKDLVGLALAAKEFDRKIQFGGKELSFADAVLVSIESRPEFIPAAREFAGNVPDHMSANDPLSADAALRKYAQDNKLNLDTLEGFQAAESGARRAFPEAFARGEEVQ